MPRRIPSPPALTASLLPGTSLAGPLLAGSLLLSCSGDAPPTPEPAAAPAVSPQERARRHAEALREALPRVTAALDAADPLPAAMVGRGPYAPIPVSLGATRPVLDEVSAAFRELSDLDASLLAPPERALLLALRARLSAVQDRILRTRPTRKEPTWYPMQVARLVDAMAFTLARGRCPSCGDALEALATQVAAAVADLGAAAPGALTAAARDYRLLAARTRRLPAMNGDGDALEAPAQAAARALDAAAATLTARAREAPGPRASREDRTLGPAGSSPLAALPPAWGAATLRRFLGAAEYEHRGTQALFAALGPAVDHLRALSVESAPPSRPRPVTEARCETALTQVRAFTAKTPQLGAVEPDCPALVRLAQGVPLDDAQLAHFVIQEGVVRPARRARLSKELPALAGVTGLLAPAAQLAAQPLTVAMGAHLPAATIRDDALTRACAALAALWLHGELGREEDLRARLTPACGAHPPASPALPPELPGPLPAGAPGHDATWQDLAETTPFRALSGLPLSAIAAGPAALAALDRYWWVPSGMTRLLADPAGASMDPTTGATATLKVEPLEPGETGPAPAPGAEGP